MNTWYHQTLSQAASTVDNTNATTVHTAQHSEYDVCVVGAGLAGLNVALELTKAGKRVIVLEQEQVAWGASGRNGGFVAPGYAQSHERIAAITGVQNANTLYAMSIEGMQSVKENIERYQIQDTVGVNGIISICRYPASTALKSKQHWLEKQFNYSVDYLSKHDIQQQLSSHCYFDALQDNNAFHFNPLAYARGLAAAIQAQGAQIREQCAVASIKKQHNKWVVESSQETVLAENVVVCTGGYTGKLVAQLQGSFLPIATYVMLTKPNKQLVETAIHTSAAILDDRRASDYYRVVDNGRRILWGGCISTRTSEPKALSQKLYKRMVATFPQLNELEVDYAWSGLMSYARHQMPQIGRLANGLWYCTAFGGHGMNTTAIGGRLIAEAITDQSQRYQLFAPFKLSPTFGMLGKAAAQSTYWRYQLIDKWQERSALSG